MMKKALTPFYISTVAAMTLSACSLSTLAATNTTTKFSTNLTANQEVIKPALKTPIQSHARANFTYNPISHTLRFTIKFTDMSGAPIMAHFHHGQVGVNGPVLQTICGDPAPAILSTCGVASNGELKGSWHVPKADIPLLTSGQIFVNIHTALNPKGELRGQLQIN